MIRYTLPLMLLFASLWTQPVAAQLPDWLNLSGDEAADSTPLAPPFGDDWTVRAGAMFLNRTDNNGDELILSAPAGTASLDASDADLGTGIGWDVSLFGPINSEHAFEVRYFQLDNLDFDTRLSAPLGVGFNVIPGGVGVFNFLTNADISYTAELQNGELNGRYRMNDDITLIYGIRHIQHDETLNGFFSTPVFPGSTNTVTFEAENFLTGPQIGLDLYLLQFGNFRVEGLIKTGLYYNHVNTQYTRVGAGLIAGNERATDSEDELSFVGELQLAAVYQITDSIALRGGYQFLALTNIATATNQVVGTNRGNLPLVTTRAVASENPIYQGLMLQLEVTLP